MIEEAYEKGSINYENPNSKSENYNKNNINEFYKKYGRYYNNVNIKN